MDRELIDYVIRNANYLKGDSYGFAQYRRPDYLVARYRGIEFHADPKLTHVRGAGPLVNKWIVTHYYDIDTVVEIQGELAQAFGAPSFTDLIERWAYHVGQHRNREAVIAAAYEEPKRYVCGYGAKGFEVTSHSDQHAALVNEGKMALPMWTGRPWPYDSVTFGLRPSKYTRLSHFELL